MQNEPRTYVEQMARELDEEYEAAGRHGDLETLATRKLYEVEQRTIRTAIEVLECFPTQEEALQNLRVWLQSSRENAK
jgi:hypothetical protein